MSEIILAKGWWVGRDNAALTEPSWNHANCPHLIEGTGENAQTPTSLSPMLFRGSGVLSRCTSGTLYQALFPLLIVTAMDGSSCRH